MHNKTIVFTGGGSTGHVSVNLAIIPKFVEDGWEVYYIGSKKGIEKQLVAKLDKVQYLTISTGKLRRYVDIKNVTDPFRVLSGIFQSYSIIRRIKPSVIFSKGGFVSPPVVLGGWLNNVPVVLHESDLSPGLANKISIPFVRKICTTFDATRKYLPKEKVHYIGPITRDSLKKGISDRGRDFLGFTSNKPVLLIMGGSLGAKHLNAVIRTNLKSLLSRFQIIHICGKGNIEKSIEIAGYKQIDYVEEELADVIALSDLVVSRAGSNAIFEFLYFRKPMVLVPLSRVSSRGDQILNAQEFKSKGYCEVVEDEDMDKSIFLSTIYKVFKDKNKYVTEMNKTKVRDNAKELYSVILNVAK
ncbi:MAG: undecaprenyldiphospho-muramoylpentapeptide beta-N-acetylglucosaminyltransferase [Alkaliphilus sp.]|nr:undecaprenyldiphospho-muramoylpentapeptide beta-N-acetylglucosaminyltransferase [bacterium AH-315-L21]MBN4069320.1 undecaprenyldiphospho-muramoylpentapeptide beta-N-acetylglucosaminyltransferase [bacterium AH-315-G05]PHS35935.1 MAG: undecaprenyldiphospho-muramoylpentapeptide beta-N-acetylglucosaminyltransferase [Alkaliphilus sp.]